MQAWEVRMRDSENFEINEKEYKDLQRVLTLEDVPKFVAIKGEVINTFDIVLVGKPQKRPGWKYAWEEPPWQTQHI